MIIYNLTIPFKTIPDSKVYTCFQTKKAQKTYPFGKDIPLWLI